MLAVDFSSIPRESLLGAGLRGLLKCLPKYLVVRIWQGPSRGMKWIVGSGVHGYWLGSYEYAKRKRFEQVVKPGMVVYDIGAHVGFYTLIASKLVQQAGYVIAFEPSWKAQEYLYCHVSMNDCHNVQIIPKAAHKLDGVKLDEMPVHRWPDVIKMDIEGGEYDVLTTARKILEQARPVIFLSTHSALLRELCHVFLTRYGYTIEPLNRPTWQEADEWLCV